MDLVIVTYVLYLSLSLALTVWVARALHTNGRVFLVDAFAGNEELADSVNHLLLVGFYLINVGFISLALRLGLKPNDVQGVFEVLSRKVGIVLLVLGVMHFFNLYVFNQMRQRRLREQLPPPVSPTGSLEAPC